MPIEKMTPAPFSEAPAQPRDAATVVVMRDSAQGPELYLVKRSREVDFMAGAHVFPGGRFDPSDASMEACAVRETFEEAGLTLDPAALVPWVRWVTPVISPRRFDARFFLARMPAGQTAVVDGREAIEGLWITPKQALERWLANEMMLPPATARSIDVLSAHRDVEEALETAARRTPPVLMPVVWNGDGRAFISLPGDPHHPDPDTLGGSIFRIQLEEGRYRPVPAG
jgi:8-oxo-dGTP pyrophosphatase MutT (NUDIX family)